MSTPFKITEKHRPQIPHILGKQWLKCLLEPLEIAATAVFLASDGAAAITGEEIGVTGEI